MAESSARKLNFDLSGKVALVTGGSGGIGRAVCESFAAAGARVAFTYFSNHDGCDATAEAIRAHGTEPVIIRVNLAHKGAVDEVLDGVREQLGRCDVFIANAASGVLKPAVELTPKHWKWCSSINTEGMFFMAQGLVKGETPLMGQGGRIVALSSLGAVRAIPQYAFVGASKAAMEALARSLALELGPMGITVNVVSPGIIDTYALSQFPNREQLLEIATLRTPVGRLCTPADVAEVVSFLCMPEAGMVHGQTINVDGGYASLA